MSRKKRGGPSGLKSREDFRKKYGSILIDPDEIRKETRMFSTGSISVDVLLRGGFRGGTLSQVYGPFQSGKSTLALSTAAATLKAGGTVLYLDMERGLDFGLPGEGFTEDQLETQGWLRTNGVDPFDPNFTVLQPLSGEEMYSILLDIIPNKLYNLVIVDSVAAIITESQAQGDVGDATYGAAAKLHSETLPKVMRAMGESRNYDTHIMFINQIRDNLRSPHGGKKAFGGNAIPHFVHYTIRMWKVGSKESVEEVATTTKVQVEKSRYAPRRSVDITISSKRGIDVTAEVLDYLLDLGLVKKSGAWYAFYEEVDAEEPVGRTQGEAAAKQWMDDNGWVSQHYDNAVQSSMAWLTLAEAVD